MGTTDGTEPKAAIPRLVVTHGVDGEDGDRTVDLTVCLVEEPLRTARRVLDALGSAEGPLVRDLYRAFPEGPARDALWDGRVRLVDPATARAAFVAAIGGEGGLRQWHELARAEADATHRLRKRLRHLAEVRGARFVLHADRPELTYDPDGDRYGTPEDTRDDLDAERLAHLGPYPWGDDAARADWEAAAARVRRRLGRPFVHGADELVWEGARESTVREAVAEACGDDDGVLSPLTDPAAVEAAMVAVDEAVLGNLDWEHHEDAISAVRDREGLSAIVGDWARHAGDGSPGDLALAGALAAWNAKQDISSHLADTSTVIGSHPDVTHAECVRWCEARVAEAEEAVRAVGPLTLPPIADDLAEVRAWQARGVTVYLGHGRPSYGWVADVGALPDGASDRRDFPTLEACVADLRRRLAEPDAAPHGP